MNKYTVEMLGRLHDAGISTDDALALRRIAMTLRRWFELECGDSNDYASWAIVRGHNVNGEFRYADDDADGCGIGFPYIECHYHQGEAKARYSRIPDRETGARKRLAKIMARYDGLEGRPILAAYVQTDPRGAPLYILRQDDVPNGADVSSYYSRGIAVHK